MPPNVLVVVLDSTRRDALEPYGASSGSTPALAQLASRGHAMPDVYATGCWTVPSHSSIFTGLLPRAAGLSRVGSVGGARPRVESHRDRLLPEVFRRAGYATGALSANLWVSEASGFATGFDAFAQVDSDRQGKISTDKFSDRMRWLAEAAAARVDDGARRLEATLARWIDEARGQERPFFWFVNLMESHSPYLPPRAVGGVSLQQRLRAAEDARRYYTLVSIWQTCAGVRRVPESTLERMRTLYAASVTYMDSWLGRQLERMEDAGLLDDTLVVALADHGENLGEGGLIAHALSLDDRLIHVPLILAGPRAEGRSISSLADLPRVLAEAAGIDKHPWTDGPPQGVGLAQLDPPLDADDPETPEKLAVAGLQDAFETFTTPVSCATAGGLKLMRRGSQETLLDLASDPLELKPQPVGAWPERQDEIFALRAALDHPSMSSRPVGAGPTPDTAASSEETTADLEERMRLLGYM